MVRIHSVVLYGGLLCSSVGFAADKAGCSDPAMFPKRIPGYEIAQCKKGSDSASLRWPGGQQQVLGLVTELVYKVPTPAQGSTPRYIAANYANALSSIGATLLEDPAKSSLGDRVTARVKVDGREVWVKLSSDSPVVGGNWQTYKLTVVQEDAAAQVVTAEQLLEALNTSGFATLYLNFDTGRAELKDDAKEPLAQVGQLLKRQPGLKLSVEGHTDNVGQPADNKALSERRARAVADAIVAQGIEPGRLSSVGYGQERPVADNRSEDGRAKNRRVELVKQ